MIVQAEQNPETGTCPEVRDKIKRMEQFRDRMEATLLMFDRGWIDDREVKRWMDADMESLIGPLVNR